MKSMKWFVLMVGLVGSLFVGCANPCESLYQRCNQCQDSTNEDRCKSVSAFNNWGQCGSLLDEFGEKNVCPLLGETKEGS